MTTIRTENPGSQTAGLTERAQLRQQVEAVINTTPVVDVHTHLFAPEFGELSLFGIDELLTYHYLVAEAFRFNRMAPERFWQMSKTAQAELIWQTLFVDHTPLSEATRGVINVLHAFGLDTNAIDLTEARAFFQSTRLAAHSDSVLDLASISDVVMTNDPFDAREAAVWESDASLNHRFHAALRMDRLLNDWPHTSARLAAMGYRVDASLSDATIAEVRRFLDQWIARMNPLYMAVSLPDDFKFPDTDARDRIIRAVVLPTARAHRLPFTMMIGVRRGVNSALRVAGDGLGKADMKAVERMCAENPDVRFMATFLSRENQHELCVTARKFSNLMPFGCWWFLNNPSIISEVTRERLELLGTSFIPQHSDARVLEQLIYKWQHSRRVIAEALYEAYEQLLRDGRAVTRAVIERDVTQMFSGNFWAWIDPATPEVSATASNDLARTEVVKTY